MVIQMGPELTFKLYWNCLVIHTGLSFEQVSSCQTICCGTATKQPKAVFANVEGWAEPGTAPAQVSLEVTRAQPSVLLKPDLN